MNNKFCHHCLEVYPELESHECTGSLKERIVKLENALKPFMALDETVTASIGKITQDDIRTARLLIRGNV